MGVITAGGVSLGQEKGQLSIGLTHESPWEVNKDEVEYQALSGQVWFPVGLESRDATGLDHTPFPLSPLRSPPDLWMM